MPSCPSDRIMRVVAMLSDNRVMVAISRMVGKEEKSNGRWIHNATIRINTEKAMEKASPISIRNAGIGKNKIDRMITMPMAKVTSRPRPSSGGIAIACVCAMDHPERKIGETNCVRLVAEACARVVLRSDQRGISPQTGGLSETGERLFKPPPSGPLRSESVQKPQARTEAPIFSHLPPMPTERRCA